MNKAANSFRARSDIVRPTRERRRKGDVGKNNKPSDAEAIYSVSTPLDRLYEAGHIDEPQHTAGQRFARHVHHAGLSGAPRTADLNAVSGGAENTYGMASSEAQAHHRQEYRRAMECIGKWRSAAFLAFVVDGDALEKVGRQMGETNKAQAVAAAREMVKDRLTRLAEMWAPKKRRRAS